MSVIQPVKSLLHSVLSLITSQQTFVALQDMSWGRLQHVFSIKMFRLPRRLANTSWRRLEDISQDVLKTSWKTKNCYAEDVLKTSWRHVLKTSWRHVLKTSSTRLQRNNFTSSKTSWRRLEDVLEDEKLLRWRRLQDMSWRRLEDVLEINKMFTGDICI